MKSPRRFCPRLRKNILQSSNVSLSAHIKFSLFTTAHLRVIVPADSRGSNSSHRAIAPVKSYVANSPPTGKSVVLPAVFFARDLRFELFIRRDVRGFSNLLTFAHRESLERVSIYCDCVEWTKVYLASSKSSSMFHAFPLDAFALTRLLHARDFDAST